MKLQIYQWLVPLLALYYIIRTVRQYSRGKYSPRNTIIWIIFWIGISLLAIMPDEIPNSIAKGLGFKDHINAIIFVALGLLFLLVFYLSAAVNRIENQLTELVRQLALNEFSKKEKPIDKNKEKILPLEEMNGLSNKMEAEAIIDIEIPNEGKTIKSIPEE